MDEQNITRIEEKLDQILTVLHGDGRNEMGMVQKMNILWFVIFKGPAYFLTLVLGALITIGVQYLSGK